MLSMDKRLDKNYNFLAELYKKTHDSDNDRKISSRSGVLVVR